jgi:protein-tyrosine phosphatase
VLTNLRPVGGPDLQRGRSRTVFRSNTEPEATPADYPPGLAAIIDLRRADEIGLVPHPLADHDGYLRKPLFDPSSSIESDPGAVQLEEQYLDWLDRHRTTIKGVFTSIAATEGDVLVCCSAGKDRTGVVSALLARVWGASLETIGEDYAATGPALVERFARERATSTDPQRTALMQRCEPAIAMTVVRRVEEQHGSVAGYLRDIGLNDVEISRL